MKGFAGDITDFLFDDPKTRTLAEIVKERNGKIRRLLVVGCGTGTEAAVLAKCLTTLVIGIDIKQNFDEKITRFVDLRLGDATRMEFDDESFDFVYSFHVLEHIPDYEMALREIHRVLKPGGGYMIGTPNRSRMVGYLGSKNTTIFEKMRWNMEDWKARLAGTFRNEDGAHAGFIEDELREKLSCIFSTAESITLEYYLRVYHMRRTLVSLISHLGISRWMFPAVYFYGAR